MNTILHSALNPEVSTFVSSIVNSTPGIDTIWLIGSMANGTARTGSDWDFIAFGSIETVKHLEEALDLHRKNIDFLIVTTGSRFRAAWGNPRKAGDLVEWQWCELSENRSVYTETKWIDREDGSGWISRQRQGIKIWPVRDPSQSLISYSAP